MKTTFSPNHPMSSVEQRQGYDRALPPDKPRPSLLETALTYARNGWPVFPLQGKLPYKDFHWREQATVNPDIIETWWHEQLNANIGLVIGEASGVIILDIDPRNGGLRSLHHLKQRYGELPRSTSRTAHGGEHKFFQYPKDGKIYPNTVELAHLPGLDIRGEGGYVVLPPSTLYHRLRYLWTQPEHDIAPLPAWLHELLPSRVREREPVPPGVRIPEHRSEQRLTQALAQAREGNRNYVGFRLACQLRDDGLSEAEARSIILAYADQLHPGKTPYTRREALASLRSAYSRPPRGRVRRRERS